MPDLPNRTEWEKKIARLMGRFLGGSLRDLIDQLGDPPDINNLTDYWRQFLSGGTVALEDLMREIALETARGSMESTGIGVDWDLVNRQAVEWARTYTYDLVKELRDSRQVALSEELRQMQRQLQEEVGAYFESGEPLKELRKRLEPMYGPVRADLIAQTETTRAASQGELIIDKELRGMGIEFEDDWETVLDDRVCPICGPLHGRAADGLDALGQPYWIHPASSIQYGPPPAHPGCRCGKNRRFND